MALTPYQKLKAHRQRKRSGRSCLTLELDLDAIADCLVAAGWLPQWDAHKRDAIRRALETALNAWAEA
jgi:hypothetical protein